MAINKKEAFSQEEQALATMAKALAHPARIAIKKNWQNGMNVFAENW